MEMQELEITIDRDGHVTIGVRGVPGEGCLGLTKNLEGAVGTVEKRGFTSEYYEQPAEVQAHQENRFGKVP